MLPKRVICHNISSPPMFYVQGHSNENKHYIMKIVPRDLFNMGDQSNITPQEGYHNDPFDDIKYLYVLSNDNELN